MNYVPEALRRLVIERAAGRCEYRLYPQRQHLIEAGQYDVTQ